MLWREALWHWPSESWAALICILRVRAQESEGQCTLLWRASVHSYVATVRDRVRLCSVETLETGEKATKTKRATLRQRESNSNATLKRSDRSGNSTGPGACPRLTDSVAPI